MEIVQLINGKNRNQDYHLSKIFESLANPGVINGLKVENGKVLPGSAFVPVERDGQKFVVLFISTEEKIINTTSGSKIFILINQDRINDNGRNNNSNGTEIGLITVANTYPDKNFIALASNESDIIIDERKFINFKGITESGLYNNAVIFIQDGKITATEILDEHIGQSLAVKSDKKIGFESPAINIHNQEEVTSIDDDDELIIYTKNGNKKIKKSNATKKIIEKYTTKLTIAESINQGQSIAYGQYNINSNQYITNVGTGTLTQNQSIQVGNFSITTLGVLTSISVYSQVIGRAGPSYSWNVGFQIKNSSGIVVASSSRHTGSGSNTYGNTFTFSFNTNPLPIGTYTVWVDNSSSGGVELPSNTITVTTTTTAMGYIKASTEGTRNNFIGFASQNAGAGEIIDVDVSGLIDMTGLTIGSNYYLSPTQGVISTSGSILVGKAISTNKLLIK